MINSRGDGVKEDPADEQFRCQYAWHGKFRDWRFPDMANAYDPMLRQIARRVADSQGIPLQEGVYVCLAGPSFETPHEVHFLRQIGADAVGMSTVHSVIVARHMGVRVLGISGITNVHSSDPQRPQETSHQEVLETGKMIAPRMIALIRGILEQL